MQFDQSLLGDGIDGLLKLLLEVSRDRIHQRTFQAIQKLVTLKSRLEAMQLPSQT